MKLFLCFALGLALPSFLYFQGPKILKVVQGEALNQLEKMPELTNLAKGLPINPEDVAKLNAVPEIRAALQTSAPETKQAVQPMQPKSKILKYEHSTEDLKEIRKQSEEMLEEKVSLFDGSFDRAMKQVQACQTNDDCIETYTSPFCKTNQCGMPVNKQGLVRFAHLVDKIEAGNQIYCPRLERKEPQPCQVGCESGFCRSRPVY